MKMESKKRQIHIIMIYTCINLCSINYETFMGPLAAHRPVYRDGNNLNEILAHKNVDVIEETKVHYYHTSVGNE